LKKALFAVFKDFTFQLIVVRLLEKDLDFTELELGTRLELAE
jgi:hypothetical protein